MFAHAQMRAATAGSHGDPDAVAAVDLLVMNGLVCGRM